MVISCLCHLTFVQHRFPCIVAAWSLEHDEHTAIRSSAQLDRYISLLSALSLDELLNPRSRSHTERKSTTEMADQVVAIQALGTLSEGIRDIINRYIYANYLGSLPAEIRWIVYRYLFPNLVALEPDSIIIRPQCRTGYPGSGFRGWTFNLLLRQTTAVLAHYLPRDQLEAAIHIMGSCTGLRDELVEHVAGCLIFDLHWDVPLESFTQTLRPRDISFIQHLRLPVDYLYDISLYQTLCTFPYLKTVVIGHCDRSLDVATNGTVWHHHHLHRLREISGACPQLTRAGYWPDFASHPNWATPAPWSTYVELSQQGCGSESTVQFDIDEEYAAWLEADVERRMTEL